MTSRSRAVVSGGLVIGLYLAGAVVSGHLSPFARRPLLDGLAPVAPYRWVDPPASVAATNLPPASGRFTLPFTGGGIRGGAFATKDVQVTVIVPHGAFEPRPGQRSITLSVDPLAPSAVASPPHRLVVLGNVVRLRATYEPSGATARPAKPIEVVLLYPFVPTDSGHHLLLVSADGTSWESVKATDHVASAQLLGSVRTLGDVAAAGTRLAGHPSSSPPPDAGSGTGTGTVVVIAVGAALVLGLLVLVFGRRGERTRR